MRSITLVFLAAVLAMAMSAGQYYVPRSYYIIDSDGNEHEPIPLRRLRRSLAPYPSWGGGGANANANAEANANSWGGGSANAIANARADANARGQGGWGAPSSIALGAANPLGVGQSRRQAGPILGHSVTSSSSVGVGSLGQGYYDQYTSVDN